jgi:hypothetical protein
LFVTEICKEETWHRYAFEIENKFLVHCSLCLFLGDKDYFFGNTPTEADCALFGQLSQWVWQAHRSPGEKLIKGKEGRREGRK